MSEAQEIDSPIAESEENINNSDLPSLPAEEQITQKSANEGDPETRKSESNEEPRNSDERHEDCETLANNDIVKMDESLLKRDNSIVVVDDEAPTSPTAITLDRNKAGECNLLPVLVERLRSALEQSCSSQSSSEEQSIPPEDSGVDSEEDLRVWASGLCNSMEQQQRGLDDAQSPRGLKLDLKFLEDLLLSDIQTALGRLQETLKRVDIGTLTRYSSTLDPTNKLNLLKLISSLLANLKIPDEAIVKPEKTSKSQSTVARRRRTDRHTIGVSSEELARARKWLEDKNVSSSVVEPTVEVNNSHMDNEAERSLENFNRQENCQTVKENPMERIDSQSHEKQYDKVPEKYMKDALNQQQSLQNKSSKDTSRDGPCQESSGKNLSGTKITDIPCNKDDNTIINEEYGISASSLYHQSNAQAKCNKFLAKKSKIKRANTIDIPNYLKLQAESMANGHGVGSLRRPINIGDRYSSNGGNVIPSFEPKTENDRKFLALINKNNETTSVSPSAGLPFKSFNYRQIATVADKNWNSRFSNIKTTFDKPQTNVQDENSSTTRAVNESRRKSQSGERDVVVGSLRLPYNVNKQKSAGFSHAPTSPFQKIEKPCKDETTPGFLKPGYLSKNGSALRAKVKMFDQENVSTTVPATLSPLPTRSRAKQFNANRASNLFSDADEKSVVVPEKSGVTENGHLNYHSFCKQFAPFATKNPTDNQHKSIPWSNGLNNTANKSHLDKRTREKFEPREKTSFQFGDENKRDVKVPVAYQSGEHCENNDRREKLRHRKLYETYDGQVNENGNTRDIVAYPFEINYQKRPTFDKKYRDVTSEKGDYEDPEDVQQSRSPPASLSSLQYIKSVLPTAINPSPPPRGIFSTQSVAVQTHQTEPVRGIYPNENRSNFASRDESVIPRRPAPPTSLSKDLSLQTRNLPNEQIRRIVNPDEPRGTSRQYIDTYQQSSCKRDNDLPQFTTPSYSLQGRSLPQNTTTTSHASYPTNYPPSTDYKTQYYPSVEHETYASQNSHGNPPPQIPVRSNLPQGISSILKNQQDQDDNYERYKRPDEEFVNRDIIQDYPDYNENIFYRDNQNPIYVPPSRNVERENTVENVSLKQLPLLNNSDPHNLNDNYNPEDARSYGDESADISEEHSFTEDENIQNQDISSTEGVITRYACAIATISPVSESPILSPIPSTLRETCDTRQSRIYDDNSQSSQRARDNEISCLATPANREERTRENDDLSLEEIRRHNLLQQNLIRKLQGDQSIVPKVVRRLSQEIPYREDITSSKMNYPVKLQTDHSVVPKIARRLSQETPYREEITLSNLNYPVKLQKEQSAVPKIARRLSQETPYREDIPSSNLNYSVKLQANRSVVPKMTRRLSQETPYRDELSGSFNYPAKLPEEQNPNAEVVIESNNTKDKINIFEGRNNSMKKRQQQFKPLSIPRGDTFVTPKINIVSPSKVFKPSFKTDSPRGSNIGTSKLPQKTSNTVDSSDEYLMSCANKPSRSIVLSKSESWHQLALSKSTLQVPQAKPCALLKPPKPKSPSSLRLSKQYEASSSSDVIRKMEDKIQRYFQGPSSGGPPDSPIAPRRDPKTKRNFNSPKSPGTLMRSHTMPHIYDETNDVEKAFDSLFKEATRSDNRY